MLPSNLRLLCGNHFTIKPNEEPPTPNSEEETGCPECFAAGTPVRTDHGNVPIEQFHVDDRVLSRNRETGALEYERVSALIPGHPGKLVDIRVEGETNPLRPSIVHPFWVKRGDAPGAWINAGHMQVGDLVQTIEGQWKRVVAITPEKDSQTVYNFTVDLNHDYFVGYQGLLVHNAPNCNCRSGNFQHEFKHAPKFGVNGPWNKANAALFEQALQAIVNGPNTVPYPVDFGPPGRSGSFTGGTAYLDQPSGLCVGFDPGGDLAFAWELGARQVEGLVVNGTLW